MNDCAVCPVEKECYYKYKPCECVSQRKFKSKNDPEAKQGLTIVDDLMPMSVICRVRVRMYSCETCGQTYSLPDVTLGHSHAGYVSNMVYEYECAQKFCSGTLKLIYNEK